MKKILLTNLVAMSLLAMGSVAHAATKNVQVKANVKATCSFADGNDVIIDMGDLRAGAGNQSKTGATQFWCSKGVNYTLSTDVGLHALATQKRMQSGTYFLPYTLTLDRLSGVGSGPGTLLSLTMTAAVLGSDIDTASVATGYTDTVILTVNL